MGSRGCRGDGSGGGYPGGDTLINYIVSMSNAAMSFPETLALACTTRARGCNSDTQRHVLTLRIAVFKREQPRKCVSLDMHVFSESAIKVLQASSFMIATS
jgi:hypothetical protein